MKLYFQKQNKAGGNVYFQKNDNGSCSIRIKDNIKKARLDAGLTQLEVAEKLGVAQAQYARWENGGRNPKDETVEKLAEIFGTSFEILKGRDDGLEEIVSLLREYELTEEDKKEIITFLENFLANKKEAHQKRDKNLRDIL